ncbi:MAG TPA: PQQ-binding-like beta-propeller repeat protein, partial [Gammaproteobacteria bacterium]
MPEPPQVPGAAAVADYVRGSDWPTANRDLGGLRYSPLREITVTNVDELRQAWAYPLGGAEGAASLGSELTPIVVGGVLYATAADRVVALEADSGEEIWRFMSERDAPSRRGLTYWPGDAAMAARIFFTAGRKLVALDAATGQR